MQIRTKFEMRDELRDTISGCQGVVVAITHYDTGCTHYSLQGKIKDGKVPDWESFDESRLIRKKKAPAKKVEPTGGPPRHKVVQT